jgi:hypothetical protein
LQIHLLPMDPNFGGRFFSFGCSSLILWIMFSSTLMNSIVTFLGDNELTLESQFLPVLWGYFSHLKKHVFWLWWKQPRQSTHWSQVESNVWHIIREMRYKKYLPYSKMSYVASQALVLKLIFSCNLNALIFYCHN